MHRGCHNKHSLSNFQDANFSQPSVVMEKGKQITGGASKAIAGRVSDDDCACDSNAADVMPSGTSSRIERCGASPFISNQYTSASMPCCKSQALKLANCVHSTSDLPLDVAGSLVSSFSVTSSESSHLTFDDISIGKHWRDHDLRTATSSSAQAGGTNDSDANLGQETIDSDANLGQETAANASDYLAQDTTSPAHNMDEGNKRAAIQAILAAVAASNMTTVTAAAARRAHRPSSPISSLVLPVLSPSKSPCRQFTHHVTFAAAAAAAALESENQTRLEGVGGRGGGGEEGRLARSKTLSTPKPGLEDVDRPLVLIFKYLKHDQEEDNTSSSAIDTTCQKDLKDEVGRRLRVSCLLSPFLTLACLQVRQCVALSQAIRSASDDPPSLSNQYIYECVNM